jgi:hypothetical protein
VDGIGFLKAGRYSEAEGMEIIWADLAEEGKAKTEL